MGGLAAALACSADERPASSVCSRIRSKLEDRWPVTREALAGSPNHLLLVQPVSQQMLSDALRPVVVHRSGGIVQLGSRFEPEPHGCGILALLLDGWRPEGRQPSWTDAYAFSSSPPPIRLGDVLAGCIRQLHLPSEPASANEPPVPWIGARVPATGAVVPRDAYALMRILAERFDGDEEWPTASGAASTDEILRAACGRRSLEPLPEALAHTRLHRLRVCLAFARARGDEGLIEALAHWLVQDEIAGPARPDGDPEAIAHALESLGRMATESALHWTAAERQRVVDWLSALDGGWLHDAATVDPHHLAHALRGARLLASEGSVCR